MQCYGTYWTCCIQLLQAHRNDQLKSIDNYWIRLQKFSLPFSSLQNSAITFKIFHRKMIALVKHCVNSTLTSLFKFFIIKTEVIRWLWKRERARLHFVLQKIYIRLTHMWIYHIIVVGERFICKHLCLPQRLAKRREGIEMNAFPSGGRGTVFDGGWGVTMWSVPTMFLQAKTPQAYPSRSETLTT